jgi:hypothetical protein
MRPLGPTQCLNLWTLPHSSPASHWLSCSGAFCCSNLWKPTFAKVDHYKECSITWGWKDVRSHASTFTSWLTDSEYHWASLENWKFKTSCRSCLSSLQAPRGASEHRVRTPGLVKAPWARHQTSGFRTAMQAANFLSFSSLLIEGRWEPQ